MARYNYFVDEKNRKVIAVSTYAKKRVKGVAIAAPGDEFDYEKGRQLAKARCDAKIAKKRLNRAAKKAQEAADAYSAIIEYKLKMSDYYYQSLDEYEKAKQRVLDLVAMY